MISVTKLLFARDYFGDRLRYTKNAHTMRNGAAEGVGPVVVWNSTKTCNLKCMHCYMQSDAKKYKDELTTEEAKKFIDDLADFHVPVLLFSGGEPLMQWPFVAEVIDRIGEIPAAVETSGYAPDDVFDDAMRKCRLILMDWKVSDPELHQKYTGVPQARIRRHAEQLAAGGVPFLLRMPIIPGVNDTPFHFETAAELVKNSKSLVRVDVLPYQRAAGAKYEMVGREYAPGFDESVPPRFHTEIFDRMGIPYRVF